MTKTQKPEPYALEKLSKAVTRLDRRGSAAQRIHDAAEGFMVVADFHLLPDQAARLSRIVARLTREDAKPDPRAQDPRVMGNLKAMSAPELAHVEAEIRALYADVASYF